MDIDAISPALRAVTAELGVDLEEVRAAGAGARTVLTVVVDRDGGVSLDEIADLSRELSAALDHDPAVGDTPYELEVTTPGVNRPLTLPRHWHRARGRKVDIILATEGRERIAGRVGELSEDEQQVTIVTRERQRMGTREVNLADVAKAVVGVDFSTPHPDELALCGLDEAEIEARRCRY